jgi:hypothetical protein
MNTSVSFTLTSVAAPGDSLNYVITTPPVKGSLSGTPPNLTYTPTNGAQSLDQFQFTVDDGVYTSPPVPVNFALNIPTNPAPSVNFQTSATNGWLVAPTNLVLTATVSFQGGINQVRFYDGTNQLAFFHAPQTNSPFVFVWTNPPVGDHFLFARVGAIPEASGWSVPVSVSVLTGFPQLSIQSGNATNAAVTWSGNTNGFYLLRAADLSGPWSLCPQPPEFTNNSALVTVPATNQQFFRLRHP